MFRGTPLIIGLVLVFLLTSYFYRKNKEIQPWMKCKESLFSQVVFKKCTPSSLSRPNITETNEINKEQLKYEEPKN